VRARWAGRRQRGALLARGALRTGIPGLARCSPSGMFEGLGRNASVGVLSGESREMALPAGRGTWGHFGSGRGGGGGSKTAQRILWGGTGGRCRGPLFSRRL